LELSLIQNSLGPFYVYVEVFFTYLMLTGPFILLALTINAFLSKLVQRHWVFYIAERFGQFRVVRYMVLPFVSLFAMTNPSCYEVGSQLKEKHKPAFYDASVSFCHPITGLFPYSNSGEIFFLIGAIYPVIKLDLSLIQFGIIYFIVGLVVSMIRGIVTEILTEKFLRRAK
jgi:PTS system glucitol/sorbitol-specific IIC component